MRHLVLAPVLALLVLPAAAVAQQPSPNPCGAPGMRCPDLVMAPPSELRPQVTPSGRRTVLRMTNRIVNVGRGPAELFGERAGYSTMNARQVIADGAGVRRRYVTGARLEYTSVPSRGGDYWKFADAARFELWRVDAEGRRSELVRYGPKLNYCLRDLVRSPARTLVPPPRRRVFPACDQGADTESVTLGTSVGWVDAYPATYPGNFVDVTGRKGCFAIVHRVDPKNAVHELDETNNASSITVRLPYRRGPQRCP